MPTLTLEQVAERALGIGGSDAAAILGCNRFMTAHDVYLSKIGQGVVKASTEEMEAGHWFEDPIRGWYEQRTGRKTWVVKETIIHPQYDYLRCHVDCFQHFPVPSMRSTVEIKFTSKAMVHDSYMLQLQHNLLVTGDRWGTVVVQGGPKQIHQDYEADVELHKSMLVVYERFWRAVQAKDWTIFQGGQHGPK